MAKPRILILSEDAALRATLARWLLGAGYAVELAESPRRAREVIANESLKLAIADSHVGVADTDLARTVERIKRVLLIAQPAK